MNRIKKLINSIDHLPPFPAVIQKALNLILHTRDVNINKVVDIVQYDPSITSKVLQLANSPLYGLRGRISSLRQAIVYIGLEELKNLLVILGSKSVFSSKYPGYESHMGELWTHSFGSAIISRNMQKYAPELEHDLFTTTLLHDVGKIIMSECISTDYKNIISLIQDENYTFTDAEKEVIGLTHEILGSKILAAWGFPRHMVEAVEYHHHPDMVPDSSLTHFVALSDIISMLLGYGTVGDSLTYKGYPELYKKYGIKEKDIENIMNISLENILNVKNLFIKGDL